MLFSQELFMPALLVGDPGTFLRRFPWQILKADNSVTNVGEKARMCLDHFLPAGCFHHLLGVTRPQTPSAFYRSAGFRFGFGFGVGIDNVRSFGAVLFSVQNRARLVSVTAETAGDFVAYWPKFGLRLMYGMNREATGHMLITDDAALFYRQTFPPSGKTITVDFPSYTELQHSNTMGPVIQVNLWPETLKNGSAQE